jgi:TonB family protein
MNNQRAQLTGSHVRAACGATLLSLVLLLTASIAPARSNRNARALTGFTLTSRVTEYDDRGNSFPSMSMKLYYSSSGDWRRVMTYASGEVVETINLLGRGIYFHDHGNNLLLKIANGGPGLMGQSTVQALMANPNFVRTEDVLGQVAYLQHKEIAGLKEDIYFTPATGPFPLKHVTYSEGFKQVEEPVELNFGEPDESELRIADYTVIEQPPLYVGVLKDQIQEQPVPSYPESAKAAGVSGTAVIQVIADETGEVVSARITGGPSVLGEAAMEAAYRARLLPVEKDGVPVKFRGLFYYKFILEKETAKNPSPGTPD